MSANKSVAVIGASGGIGAAIAERIAQDAAVMLGYRNNRKAADGLAQKIESSGGRASVSQIDITDHHSVQAFLLAAQSEFGRLDSIIVATGPIIPICAIIDVSIDDFKHVINTEVIGSFNVVKTGVKILRQQPGHNKSILFVLSCSLLRTLDYDGMSFIPKMAVEGLIRQTVREIGHEGIRLNGMGIGGFAAGMGDEDRLNFNNNCVSSIIKDCKTPSGRMGTGAEVAEVAAFLISNGATYVNGQILGVDGGYSA
ncbi:hypothetical protein MMC08_007035 [Hypocenomyce scalaris]|nr:hypothetical protein [Hypocenomyce scalaris]